MSKSDDIAPPNEAAGILLAGSAYAFWGVFPLYWDLLAVVPPFELVLHRMLWCALFTAVVTAARGRLRTVWRTVCTKRLVSALALSGVLIAINWTIYIWSIATAQLVEASLGYYMTPLLSIALGVVMLGEKLSRFRLAALTLAAVAVCVMALRLGHVPWIALGLALSFGFYGYVRKLTPVDSLDGLTIEMGLFFPLSLGSIAFWAWRGTGVFPSAHLSIDALLLLGGPVTALPLALFAAGARRVRMTTLGFLQYLAPTITLLLATLFLGEKFTSMDAAVFGCVWVALLLVGLEGPVARSVARQGA